ncbi:hypothetical protein CD30_03180 [Ureibacillus massiliensis 4400831 = CIP 108448 = CCUG 49529]|uniref:Uncharacterized protein n=1 Tax=Ureibacillus massiliensis 4400831 = CIP 108448 = CCUG 49529 TaxID=1211035 RepID=A0A0A3J9R9_9BACL|nr:hypothetical protein CD30_03180 [Ureibacillus massiliensis 4400831 = CIP 108448 = CCUG 49529]RKJ53770.1 hypothetical protein D7X33_31090 [Butyricicoccus sp. 1XD8-22]
MEFMFLFFYFSCIYLMPIYGLAFCLSLVSLLKKINKEKKDLTRETSFLTISFILIIWSISVVASR